MSLNFPNSPAPGDVHNENGSSWTWDGAAWLSSSEIGATIDIVKSGLPAVGWQIAGDVLTIAGTLVTNGAGNGAYTFPKAFKTPPSVVLTPINIFGAPVLDVIMSVTSVGTTGFTVVSQAGNIFTGPVDYGFVALGEALDADKMPKTIPTVGGVGQFASNAEAVAGTATTMAARRTEDGLPGANWQIVGNVLTCWGGGTTLGSAALLVNFPRQFKSTPRVTVTPFSAAGARRTAHLSAKSASQVSVVCLDENNAQTAMAFDYLAIGEALDADKLPQ